MTELPGKNPSDARARAEFPRARPDIGDAGIDAVMLRNRHGLCAEVTNLGAALSAMWAPDRNGRRADVVLGYAGIGARVARRDYFGVSVGRVAGRISRARFALDASEVVLDANESGACLHGGPHGFDTRVWRWLAVDAQRARLQLISDDGDQGFPGRLSVEVEYRLDDADELWVEYSAVCDRPTVVNLTHHPFWNLAGEGAGAVDGHELTLFASRFAVLDEALLPTGEIRRVDASAFDFRTPRRIADGLRDSADPQLRAAGGYDHYWILDEDTAAGVRLAARLSEPGSGRVLEVFTDQPGLQFYSGNFLDGSVTGKSAKRYRARAGLCLEPQAFPDAANRPEFPSIRVEAGQIYRNRIGYRFSGAAAGSEPGRGPHPEQGDRGSMQ
ncbi:MAG: aldose epimerase family protein [Pseudoxanthomonas sp.]